MPDYHCRYNECSRSGLLRSEGSAAMVELMIDRIDLAIPELSQNYPKAMSVNEFLAYYFDGTNGSQFYVPREGLKKSFCRHLNPLTMGMNAGVGCGSHDETFDVYLVKCTVLSDGTFTTQRIDVHWEATFRFSPDYDYNYSNQLVIAISGSATPVKQEKELVMELKHVSGLTYEDNRVSTVRYFHEVDKYLELDVPVKTNVVRHDVKFEFSSNPALAFVLIH